MKDEILYPSDNGDQIRTRSCLGTSLTVKQFVAFMRGEDAPHEPSNPWIIQAIIPSQQYCLGCCGVRWFDVIQAVTVDGRPLAISICRCCGAEV